LNISEILFREEVNRMHAFIVRPFGTKNGIDFDRVHKELISPALEQLNFSGGTTGEFIQQGNIRIDMFEQLLIADLVVADISIHNANAFYELGIRHAFRDKRTFLIKSKGDEVPFDLKTDRYMLYDANDPAASLSALIEALKATRDSQKQDSPVFQLLPGLPPTDPTNFMGVPLDFHEEVERAESSKNPGLLQMLSAEVDGFAWTTTGLRLIGITQFKLKDWPGARATWEAVRKYDDMDLEANTLLGTIYQRLGDLVRSDQALERALQNTGMSNWDRAEIRALMARNAKTLWEAGWEELEVSADVQKAALSSPHLERSFDLYRKGFVEDRNHFYSGLNALAMSTIITELAAVQPDVWEDDFDDEDEAALKLRKLEALRSDLAAGVKLAIESKRAALARDDQADIWAEISAADLTMLSSTKPNRVGRAYKKTLAGAQDFERDSARKQLLLYRSLGILTENTQAALDNIPAVEQTQEAPEAAPQIILFTGHRIDAPDRQNPRFPPDREDQARAMILGAVSEEKEKATGKLLGISGGASGGDILFHEVCQELEIPSQMYLVLPKTEYIKASVADGGPKWSERFKRLFDEKQPEILSESGELPRWLRTKPGYSIWQRSNLWMLHSALAISNDHLTLIALWNGEIGDGPGGTEDMVKRAQDRGATFIHLDARKLVE
jgi:tetratricopeptide (TPR) repeat protein